jgi:hypothetical protein
MKAADVKEGGTYLTLVSGLLTRVVVVRAEQHRRYSFASMKETTRVLYRVRTEDGKPLPKLRTAAGLRPVPEEDFCQCPRHSDWQTEKGHLRTRYCPPA